MVMTYLYTKHEVPTFSSSKVIARKDRQTDRQTCVKLLLHYYAVLPQTRLLKIERNVLSFGLVL